MKKILRSLICSLLFSIPVLVHADVPDTVTIPLQLFTLSNGQSKLGIEVSLGGGAYKMYEFDTGGSGFYAANSTAWWTNYTTVNATIVNQTYSSGVYYNSTIVSTTIDLGYGLPTVTANMAQIQTAGGGDIGPNWQSDVDNDIPPLYGNFFGDFGATLVSKNGIFGILPQLPGNLSSGFIVHTGGFNGTPTLQIGITAADRANFTLVTPMLGMNGNVTFPNSGLPTYSQELVGGNASFTLGNISSAFDTTYVLDTGAPKAQIHDDGWNGGNVTVLAGLLDSNSDIVNGTLVNFTMGNLSLDFPAGTIPGVDLVHDADDNSGYINVGLTPFLQYDVMFDVQQGLVRFRPATAVPEPGATALLASAGAGALVLWRRRQRRS